MKHIPWLGQWVAAIMVGIGIGVEFALGANIGFVLVTLGALLFAIATKLRGRD